MNDHQHSVALVSDKCIGCTDCIKRCPTQAIRVRDGKAVINGTKCIDCGLCIKVCSHHAKKATTSSMDIIRDVKYKVAIPAPTIYSQFKKITDVNIVLTAIKQLGFDEVFEVSKAAEMVTNKTRQLVKEGNLKKPIISSACPAIIRLICMRYPSLIENILHVISPAEVAAKMAKDYLENKGIRREDIGVFFISPCAAKNTYVIHPLGIEKSEIDGVISMQDIYMELRNKISRLKDVEVLATSGMEGIDWAVSGGESKGVYTDNAIAVDGVENVEQVLEEIENGQLSDVDFVEGLACIGGCIGGPLTVVNGFVAKNRFLKVATEMSKMSEERKRKIHFDDSKINYMFTKKLEKIQGSKLDEDISVALKKMEQMDKLYTVLPHINCGSCGSPTCRTLAEDIVRNEANIEDCVFMLRKKVKELAEAMYDLSSKMPQTSNSFTEK